MQKYRFLLVVIITLLSQSIFSSNSSISGEIKTTSSFNKAGGVTVDQYSINSLGLWALGNQGNGVDANLNFENTWTSEMGIAAKALITIKSGSIMYSSDWTPADFQLTNAHIEMQGFMFSPGATIWAGVNEDLKAIHILDWCYRKYSGLGVGLNNLRLGDNNLDINFYNSMRSGAEADITYDELTNSDLAGYYNTMTLQSNYQIPLSIGTLEVEAAGHLVPSADEYQKIVDENLATWGVQGGAYLLTPKFFAIDSGYTEWGIQAGYGLPTGDRLGQNMYMESNNEEAFSTRAVYSGLIDSDTFQIMSAAAFQYDMDIDTTGNSRMMITGGARPVYQLNRNLALMGEYGIEYLKDEGKAGATNDNELAGLLHKGTVAVALTLDQGFWSRPQIRIFSTFATWDPELNSSDNPMSVDVTTFGDDRNMAINFGINMEVWY